MKNSKKSLTRKLLTMAIVITVISSFTLFSSCVATVRTPRHERSTVVIESHDNGNHFGQYKHKHK